MVVGPLKWLLAGALVSFGVVGFLTGLILVPFGIALATAAAYTDRMEWPWCIVGLGLGPAVLLGDDAFAAERPSGTVSGFWVGIVLIVSGVVLAAVRERARQPRQARC